MGQRRVPMRGEPGGDRTRDQQIKSLLLYQLSYRPPRHGVDRVKLKNAGAFVKALCIADACSSLLHVREGWRNLVV
jgi:hypothetical protein